MPLNHHFSPDIPQPVWWGTQHPFMEPPPKTPSPTTTLIYPNSQFHRSSADANSSFSGEELPVETADAEHMFEKPLTPSDVGKLNRLVIPKQHAEKYFPIGAGGGADSGLLLSFEDESGKFWKFRYSYWNSSQSYVLTKGWSRFVKEKRLDAGDVVVFGRDRTDVDRLFIGWRRRTVPAQPAAAGAGVNGGWSQVCYSAHPYPSHSNGGGGGAAMPIPYQPDCLHAGIVVQNQTSPTGNSKILRLFGVNLECQSDDGSEPSNHEGPSVPSQGQAAHHCTNDHTSYPQSYMEFNLSRDVNQMRYDLG